MDFKRAFKTLILATASGAFTLTAFAHWQWLDKDGRKVFSDRAPPADVKEKNILKRPPGSTRLSAPSTESEAAATAANPAIPVSAAKAGLPKLSGKDAELEARKKKSEDDDAAKRKVEEDKIAKNKGENCERAKSGLAALQSGLRMSSVNAKGERELFDDARRALETKRTQEIIDSSCR